MLQTSLPAEATLEQAFEAIDHLNQGKLLITDPHEQLALAKLNLETAQRAKAAAAYATALNYLHAGESYLADIGTDIAWREHYPLTYNLYKMLAELGYLNGDFAASTNYIDFILKYAQTDSEKVDIYILSIIQKTLTAHYQEAIEISYQALKLLGIDLQTQDLQKLLEKESNQVKENLQGKTLQMLLDAPVMTHAISKVMIKLLGNIVAPSYIGNPSLHALIITMSVNLVLQYGNTEESAFVYSGYGTLLNSRLNEIQLSYDFGLLAIKLSDKFHHLSSQCRTNFVQGWALNSWRKPLREAEAYLNRAQQTGLEAVELQFLGYTMQAKVILFFYQGLPLTMIEQELHKLLRLPYVRTNQVALGVIHTFQLVILNLKGQTPQETIFQDAVKTDVDYQAEWQQEKSFFVLGHYLILKAQALYLHGQFVKALEVLLSAQNYLAYTPSQINIAAYNFYHSLVLVALYPKAEEDTKHKYLQQLEMNQAQMKIWADNCPENFLHKYSLVAAEMTSIVNDCWKAEEQYDRAIQLAQQQGFIQEQALANELAAKFCLTRNRPSYVRGLLQAAYHCYERWGAKHKVDQLMLQYGELLKPLPAAKLSDFSINGKEETISANSLRLLDLTSIIQTSQTISTEVNLPRLLVKIMNILIENAGAQKGAFLLEESGNLLVQAEYTLEGRIKTLMQLPLVQWDAGARSIIEYVKRAQQSVLLGNASTDKQFSQDHYIKAHHSQSVLCIPVIKHRQLKGILYLENNLAPYIFTEQHLQILTILASQIAISLENVTFYESIRLVTERLNLALQSGDVGTWSWNIPLNKMIWDQFMCDLYGIKLEEFGQTYESAIALVHPEDVAQVEQAVKQAIDKNTPFNIEYRIIKPDKSIAIMASRGQVYRDDKGQVERMLGVVWDITQRKRLEQEHLQALAQAEEKERHRAEDAEKYRKDMEDFINLVCHEIRNPMVGIYGNTDFLQQTTTSLQSFINTLPVEAQFNFAKLLDKLNENIKEIELCVNHQKAIVNDVLDLTKLEAGKMALTAKSLRLKAIIEEVAKMFATPMAAKKLSLDLLLPESDPWIKGDANRLKMVLINFMANALKFTEQGAITISLQLLDVTPTHTSFAISVKDTGRGMTPEEQTQLFQRFVRVGAAEYEGSGLGLLISKRFIEWMGGKIDVKSQKGLGSQFTIQLTCETAPVEEKLIPLPVVVPVVTPPAPPSPVSPAAKRILVVEDNKLNQRILRQQLEQVGCSCEVANNGQEAIDKWSPSAFDLIFMDIEMPVMGGLEATQRIREEELQVVPLKKTPIIGVSAYASKESIQQAIDVGMDGYITKPYKKEEIYAALKKWIESQSELSTATKIPEDPPMLPAAESKKPILVNHTFVCQSSDVDYPVHSVHLAGSFNDWLNPVDGRIKGELYPQWRMRKDGILWKLTVMLAPGSYLFKYVINETVWRSDPNYVLSADDYKNSILQIDPPKHEMRTPSAYLIRQTFLPPPPRTSKAEETEEEKKPEDGKDYAMMGPKGYK